MKSQDAYSAKVSLWLFVGDAKLALSHVGPTYVRVRDANEPIAEPCHAELEITVNGHIDRRPVYLPHGLPPSPERVTYW